MKVLEAIQNKTRSFQRNLWGGTIGTIVTGQALALGAAASHIPEHLCLGVGLASVLLYSLTMSHSTTHISTVLLSRTF